MLTIPNTTRWSGGFCPLFRVHRYRQSLYERFIRQYLSWNRIFDVFAFDDFTIGTAQQVVVAGVPTLTEWGMAFMALLLAVSGVFYIRRQRTEFRR